MSIIMFGVAARRGGGRPSMRRRLARWLLREEEIDNADFLFGFEMPSHVTVLTRGPRRIPRGLPPREITVGPNWDGTGDPPAR